MDLISSYSNEEPDVAYSSPLPSLNDAKTLAASRIPKNTQISTQLAISRFTEYLKQALQKPPQERFEPDFLNLAPDLLSEHLSRFWVCILIAHSNNPVMI
jgi:hypothetical protein